MTIGADTLTCAKEYLAVPTLSDSGFLKATATNTSSYPFLTGSGSVFYDENFVSTCSLPRTSVNGKFEVSVGEDSAIQVKRELIDKSSGSAGVFGRRTQSSYRYRISVENLHATAQSVTLVDQLPITQNDDIEIKAQEIAPPPDKPADADKQKQDGILRWTLSLLPLEKKEVRLNYSVVHPEQVAVYNLE